MEAAVYSRFVELAYTVGGIVLEPGKDRIVGARIASRMRALGLASAEQYLDYLHADGSGEELRHLVDALVTNYTWFARDPEDFDALAGHVRALVDGGRRRVRIWSAACATGEEPYSMAFSVADLVDAFDLDLKILATDVSSRALEHASRAVYDDAAMKSLDAQQRSRFFEPRQIRTAPRRWAVKPALRKTVLFRRCNLTHLPLPLQGPLDVVFCRNVMIYFDAAQRQALLDEIERLLAPGGLLVIGKSETLIGVRSGLRRVEHSVYRREPLRAGDNTP